MFDRFTSNATQVMHLAREEAIGYQHEYLGTEHILLGILRLGTCTAGTVLQDMGISLPKVRAEVDKIVQPGPSPIARGQLPFTPRGKKILELALEEASSLGHNYIGTEHLLLAFLKENEGIAARVLMNLGVTLEHVREAVIQYSARQSSDELSGNNASPETRTKETPITVERQGEIALRYLKYHIRQKGFAFMPDIEEQIAATADTIGISKDEAMVFAGMLIREFVDEVFPPC